MKTLIILVLTGLISSTSFAGGCYDIGGIMRCTHTDGTVTKETILSQPPAVTEDYCKSHSGYKECQ